MDKKMGHRPMMNRMNFKADEGVADKTKAAGKSTRSNASISGTTDKSVGRLGNLNTRADEGRLVKNLPGRR